MKSRIYISPPDIGPEEELAVQRAIRSGWVAPLGPEVDAFETELSSYVGRKHGVALNSGTSALHLGLLTLGVTSDDIVVTSTMTFAATVNAIRYVGAAPFFIDSEPNTGNMSISLLEEGLTRLRKEGKKIGAIIPVDIFGKSADYLEIEKLAEKFGIPVLSDSAESLGASFMGKKAGSFGEASAVSFNGNKIMTTSGGGMLLTDNEDFAHQVRFLATQARERTAHYEHKTIGFNYRMSNILAAIGRAQLKRLDSMISSRKAFRDLYKSLFSGLEGIEILGSENDHFDNNWLTCITLSPKLASISPRRLAESLNDVNIETRPLWKPMHLQPIFKEYSGIIDGTAEKIFHRGIALPSGSATTQQEREFVVSSISQLLK